ncbi:Rhamnogalacturonan endolyase YesW precursor [Sedimentisphaera cyanobacteriorum]|uniref:Rhamnogalacturonan endolyase YesW n=1 Tax=Sedimentisphaera cyanobacteriorum TaxID=1940790 RepID=A0A1Q2HNY5_9BACT|nr:LamG-like jellyroll fold domain-containing protein [Sedimentisphaera cyanobacteriorum]AQQ08984.1 Rhamnogalacturonan endolyase YesW precursor [Sedimentisphaera cyanobacteriorum]
MKYAFFVLFAVSAITLAVMHRIPLLPACSAGIAQAETEKSGFTEKHSVTPKRKMENLGRGVAAVRTSGGVFISWRLLGVDPVDIGFNIYRSADGSEAVKLNSSVLTGATCYTDTDADAQKDNSYYVKTVINGQEKQKSKPFTIESGALEEPCIVVPLSSGNTDKIHFVWVGDLDGDGEYDFVLDRLNNEGRSQKLEAYRQDGTLLWSADLGSNSTNTYNIEPGSSAVDVGHWDGVTVYDLDSDGKSEVALRTANGVTFGDGETLSASNDNLQFISILDGETGSEEARIQIPTDYISDGPMPAHFGVGYLDGINPSLIASMKNRIGDGEFNMMVCAWDFDGENLEQKWKWLRGPDGGYGGVCPDSHNIRIVDADQDGEDEFFHLGFGLESDGTLLYDLHDSGVVHGDRFHIGKFDPTSSGLNGYAVQQDNPSGLQFFYFDPSNGEILWQHSESPGDVGRGEAADIDPRSPGYEVWAFSGVWNGPTGQQITSPGEQPWPCLRLWWDGDLLSENFNDGKIEQWDCNNSWMSRIVTTWHYHGATHSYRGAPMFYGDIWGDWREEAIMTNPDYTELVIFTTDIQTDKRLYTLPHNPAYRNSMTVKGYMQSHQLDYYLGEGMTDPPKPNIQIVDAASQADQITIENDILTFPSLSDETVNLSCLSELHLTGGSSVLSNCQINLNSEDAFVFLEGIKPSQASDSAYLSQIKVSGEDAVLNENVRVVQYESGAVIIPHSQGFKPLELFAEENFLGRSAELAQYVNYNSGSLGQLSSQASSFILKRGYTVTLAQNEDGSGFSKNYVAQDCDLLIGSLPPELDGNVNFARIFPWRWTPKKGIAGGIGSNLDIGWSYNWNISETSTLDKEYVPIRQNRWWPGLGQDWQSRGSSHLLGYNEPDSSSQSDIAVGDAIWSWPDLLSTGLRVGSPAVTDGGVNSWLVPFMQQADSENLRVDFVAVHYYRCRNPQDPAGAAEKMYNYMKNIHDQTGRPIWVTEWNNGANWTDCPDPTYQQQADAISAMIDMMENTPWVERYAIYNWVEDVRRVQRDDGSLTPAGEVYKNRKSKVGFQQQTPDFQKPSRAAYYFSGSFLDSSGEGNNPLVYGAPALETESFADCLALDGKDDYLVLPENIAGSDDFTFAAWVYWDGGEKWQRIFDFGNNTDNYMFITPSTYSSQMRFSITQSGYNGEKRLESGAFPVNEWTHVAVVLDDDTGRLYINGSLEASESITLNPSDISASKNYLGKSNFSADPLFSGILDDVIISDAAFSAVEIEKLMSNSPPQFNLKEIDMGSCFVDENFSFDLSAYVSQNDSGDNLIFHKISGPQWLSINSQGQASGSPESSNAGMNYFIFSVEDSAGAKDFATVRTDVELDTYVAAHWNFDGGTPGAAMNNTGQTGQPCAADLSGNGYELYAWDDTYGPSFSQTGQTPSGLGLSCRLNGGQDAYTNNAGINNWAPEQWTVECAVKLDSISGWQTFIGKDGSSHGEAESDFYLQKNGIDNKFRVNFDTAGGHRYVLDSDFAAQAGKWYCIAAVSDGSTLKLYADKLDGNGSQLAGTLSLNPGSDNSLSAAGHNWTVGRGWFDGSQVDHVSGFIDDIKFSSKALKPSEFLHYQCGAWGYHDSDLNQDCFVDIEDYALFISEWDYSLQNLRSFCSQWLKSSNPYSEITAE